jgi:hypothetical protein
MSTFRTIAVSAVALAGLTLLPSAASATPGFYKFYSGGPGYTSAFSGTGTIYDMTKGLATLCPTSNPSCGSMDVMGSSLIFGSNSFTGGPVTATATAHLSGATGQQVWDDLAPYYAGLGVDSLGVGDSSEDQISGAEVLTLSFADQVKLTGVATLFDPAHVSFDIGFATAEDVMAAASRIEFEISVDGGAWTDVSFLNANKNLLNFTGRGFSFRQDKDAGDVFGNPSYYVAAVNVVAVPEPSTLSIVGTALMGFVGFAMYRRRLKSRSA